MAPTTPITMVGMCGLLIDYRQNYIPGITQPNTNDSLDDRLTHFYLSGLQ